MRVVCAARRADRLEQVVQEIRTGGGQAESLVMDVALPGENARLISFCLERFGSLFSVFSNAGYGIERSVLDYSQAELTAIFQTNFWSSLELMRLAARHMLEANPPPVRGHVLACSSCVSKIGLPNFAAYSGTKALQDHFGRAMRAELSSRGVLVSTVHPIGTRTEFFDTASSLSGAERTSIQTPDRLKQHPDVVARAIVGRLRRSVGGEVWTSLPIRLALAGAIIAPGLIDALLRKRQREMDSAR